jgi:hypothetical protein
MDRLNEFSGHLTILAGKAQLQERRGTRDEPGSAID